MRHLEGPVSRTTRIWILLYLLMLPACGRMPVEHCDEANIRLEPDSRLPGCLQELLWAGSVPVADHSGPSGFEFHGSQENPNAAAEVERGGGFPDVLGVPLYSERAWQGGYELIVREASGSTRPKAPPWLEVTARKVRDRHGRMPSREIRQFLASHLHRFEHRYQQKYPWAAPRVGQEIGEKEGPDGIISFSMTITSDGRIVRCRSRETEGLRGLGDRVCSEMETWNYFHQANGEKMDPSQVEFDLVYQWQKPACWAGSTEYLDLRVRPRAPAPICWAPWKNLTMPVNEMGTPSWRSLGIFP